MDIFRIYSQNNNYKTISYEKTPLMRILGSETWGNYVDIESFKYEWNCDTNKRIECDCPFLIGAIPIFRENIISKIKFFLSPTLVDILPIEVAGKIYCIIRAKILLENIINVKKSKINKYPDGRIMNIEKYVFTPQNDLPCIFKIQQYPLFSFITSNLASYLKMENPTGLQFEKIDIKRNWKLL